MKSILPFTVEQMMHHHNKKNANFKPALDTKNIIKSTGYIYASLLPFIYIFFVGSSETRRKKSWAKIS